MRFPSAAVPAAGILGVMGRTSHLADWLGTPLGTAVLAIERDLLQEQLVDLVGFELLQFVAWGDGAELADSARTQHRRLLDPQATGAGAIRADYHALPVASGTIEAVLLPHTLEHAARPHELLREVDRVLRGEGHLVICGFSPLSFWGLRHALAGRHFPPVVERLLSEHRIRDWLRLLGFEITCTRRYLFAPPSQSIAASRAAAWLEVRGRQFATPLAGAYLIKARKRVHAVTPIRPVWQKTPKLVGGLAKPTTRSAA
jgi:SAM-dependent methyltransferase